MIVEPTRADLLRALGLDDASPANMAKELAAELDVLREAIVNASVEMIDIGAMVSSLQRRTELLATVLGSDVHENFAVVVGADVRAMHANLGSVAADAADDGKGGCSWAGVAPIAPTSVRAGRISYERSARPTTTTWPSRWRVAFTLTSLCWRKRCSTRPVVTLASTSERPPTSCRPGLGS